jgi:Ca-activated chloride channel family protein
MNVTRRLGSYLLPLLVASVAVVIASCGKSGNPQPDPGANQQPAQKQLPKQIAVVGPGQPGGPSTNPAQVLELVFTYGSEKEKWIEAVTKEFNDAEHRNTTGKIVRVRAIPMGSGESMGALLGRFDPTDPNEVAASRAHLTSPASKAFVELANDEARARGEPPLLEDAQVRNLVLSPVVIAMWEPMAKALGWPEKPLGWKEVLDLASAEKGWGSVGKPQWGRFKFGHTHPEHSNSGLITVLAETYAGAAKTRGLTEADVHNPQVQEFVRNIERSVVAYGSSTGFFGRRMARSGPGGLSAAVLYENMVIEANRLSGLDYQLVALYPREGTFWSDHPVGVVERPWVTPEHRAAAMTYIEFLRHTDRQTKAMTLGFRPGKEGIPLDPTVFSAANGVNPNEPRKVLEIPDAPVMRAVLDQWPQVKKAVRLALVLDISGSMNKDQRLVKAKAAAREFVKFLGPRDQFTFLVFNDRLTWVIEKPLLMDKAGKARAIEAIDEQLANAETALFDAIGDAFDQLQREAATDRLSAVVVLTDGEDNKSKLAPDKLLTKVRYNPEGSATRVFTIAYGQEAEPSAQFLKQIAEVTTAEAHTSDPKNIQKVFRKILQGF